MNWIQEYIGLRDFSEIDALQKKYHHEVFEGLRDGWVIGCEHPSIVTSGAQVKPDLNVESVLGALGLPLVACDRGGKLTIHSPGQLVIYPIVPVRRLGVGTQDFVRILGVTTLETLKEWGVPEVSVGEEPGLFCGAAKIASIGIRIDRGVSRHGVSINVNNDLSLFAGVETCGMRGRAVTSLEKQTTLETSELQLMDIFQNWFDLFRLQLNRRIAISETLKELRS